MEPRPVRISRLQASEPELMVEAIRGAHLDARILGKSREASEFQRISLPRCCFDAVRLGPSMLFSGEMGRDCHTLIYVTKCPQDGHAFNFGHKHGAGFMGIFAPGGTLDAFTPAGYENISLTMPEPVFRDMAAGRFSSKRGGQLASGTSLRISNEAQQAITQLLGDMFKVTLMAPDWLENEVACAHFEEDLLDACFRAMGDGHEAGKGRGTTVCRRRYATMRKIRDYIAAHPKSPLRLDDLCIVSGMSRRGLEYLFRDLMGMGVNAFIRCQRLHGVRKAIAAAEPGAGSIKRIALDWGFWHLGRFSAEYKALLGEHPGQTRSHRNEVPNNPVAS